MAGQTVVVSVLADTKRFSSAMKQLSSATGVGRIGSAFKRTTGAIVTGLKNAIKWTGALGLAVAGLAIKGGISRLLDIEDAQSKLRGLGHDAKSVQTIMDNALASVRGTSFGLGEAATIAASAVAAGVQPGRDLERTLKLVADTATIAGSDLNEMGQIFNKVGASNKITMQEVNQLATRGVPILQWLADQYGVTAEEASKMVSSGKVDFEAFRQAVEDNISGAALESGETTRGAFKNMLAAFSRTGAQLVGAVFPIFKEVFLGIIDFLGPIEEKAGEVGAAIAEWVSGTMVPALQTFAGFVQDNVLPIIQAFWGWVTGSLLPALVELGQTVGGALSEAWAKISGLFSENSEKATALASDVGDTLTKAIGMLGDILAKVIPLVAEIVEWLIRNRDIVLAVAAGFGTGLAALKAFMFVKNVTLAVKALNAALLANPLGLVITLIAALVAGLVLAYQRSETFRSIVQAAFRAVQTAAGRVVDAVKGIVNWFKSLKSGVRSAMSGLANVIRSPFTTAFNAIKSLWNRTLGRVSFSVPSWIPGIGGKGWSFPRMHSGGIFMPQDGSHEGLALLRRGERVLTPGQDAASGPQVIENHIHIGDEVVRVVRTEINESNRALKRRAVAGVGIA